VETCVEPSQHEHLLGTHTQHHLQFVVKARERHGRGDGHKPGHRDITAPSAADQTTQGTGAENLERDWNSNPVFRFRAMITGRGQYEKYLRV